MKYPRKIFIAAICSVATILTAAPVFAGSNDYSLGLEGFYDNYKEPIATVDSDAYYGSITGNYTHNWTAFFAALDGRVSYGEEKYDSESGTAEHIPQWELDGRIRGGYTFRMGNNALSPYIGVGTRYYWDEGKGVVTNLGSQGYDRRITQIYIPIGVTYSHPFGNGYTIAPNIEYDQLAWGQVSTRLGTFPGFNNIINTQSSGFGFRGNIMLGFQTGATNWQVGPFLRYWDIKTSNLSNAGPFTGEEPDNLRLQVGLAVRAVW